MVRLELMSDRYTSIKNITEEKEQKRIHFTSTHSFFLANLHPSIYMSSPPPCDPLRYDAVFAAVRDCYEAYAVYTFIALLIAILEDGQGLQELLNKVSHIQSLLLSRHVLTSPLLQCLLSLLITARSACGGGAEGSQ